MIIVLLLKNEIPISKYLQTYSLLKCRVTFLIISSDAPWKQGLRAQRY